jgi:primosomal protein N' (replication factor Y)
MFAEVILPVPLPTLFSYRFPEGWDLKAGMRVQVPLGKSSIYKGMVRRVYAEDPDVKGIKDIQAVLDPYPIVSEEQMKFWEWMASYYMCTLGEVYRAALPRGLKESWSPRYISIASLEEKYRSEDALNWAMDKLVRAPKQLTILQRFLEIVMEGEGLDTGIPKPVLASGMDFSESAYQGLLKKKILVEYREQAVRMPGEGHKLRSPKRLSAMQSESLESIRQQFGEKPVVLLKGITSSGKTEIYIRLIQEMLQKKKQVLYLLPEIALTAQIIERLKEVFGDKVGIYHSKYSDAERVETFIRARENNLGKEFGVILGARSAVFLPFRDLGLVIVDEEYEQSYKQADPAPRYHARDAAIVLAEIHKAKVLLGSATPSFESYYNARTGKYGMVELKERYGKILQPELFLANLREAYRKKKMISHFHPELYERIQTTLSEERQVILFQNRRGFSPYVECFHCGWIPVCRNCDVNLVYHKLENRLICHYCGYAETIPRNCPECAETRLVTRGFGTERLEDEVESLFPDVRIARMDLDTTRSRKKYERIIRDFESGNTRILVGTQIITKGLDFNRVGLVGVLNADNLLNFPDFRSFERCYQLISQVAGRAGRKERRGSVVVQTSLPEHPVMQHILKGEYHSIYLDQMEDRQAFHYPPYYRLIRITLRHAETGLLDEASSRLAGQLRNKLPEVLGPQSPPVGKVQQQYLMILLIKLPRSPEIANFKRIIAESIETVKSERKYGKLFIVPDVDPY